MRAVLSLILLMFVLVSYTKAQNIVPENSKVDIREYVDKQIKNAETKNDKKTSHEENTSSNNISKFNYSSFIKANKDSLMKAFFLADASLLAAIIVLYRRRSLKIKELKAALVNDNIQLLREEKIGVKYQNQNTGRKIRLFKKDSMHINGSESITKLAKKLNISKGEIHLAAKMKMLANN